MNTKWMSEKSNLENLILNQKLSYEEIGRRYGCTGANIKKVAKLIGISLPKKRKINPKEKFTKGFHKKCKFCGKLIPSSNTYCSSKCCGEQRIKDNIQSFLDGNLKRKEGLPLVVKNYLLKQANYKCELCGFEGYNKKTGNTILQIHHIDGHSSNNVSENLQVLCPNCHAMTENFMALNNGNSDRITRYAYKDRSGSSTAESK